ncbi:MULTISPECIES: UPF0182 family protein [Aerosakkonema]|uniref:UPF0182 family protein n=1 Tax=Aerosakkonema TaxID=1246629 RepID=UPI0035B9733D
MLWKIIFQAIALLLGLWLVYDLLSHLAVEILWFNEVGYLSVFLLSLKTQLGLWAIASTASTVFIVLNLWIARRWQHPKPETTKAQIRVSSVTRTIKLPWLLPIVVVLSFLIGMMLIHYGRAALNFWQPDRSSATAPPLLPPRFDFSSIWQILGLPSGQIWWLGVLTIMAIPIISRPQFCLKAVGLLMSLCFGVIISGYWAEVLQYFHPILFNRTDPLFHRDISFYVFILPGRELLEFWLVGLFLYTLLAVALVYLLSGDSLSQGIFPGFSRSQQRHLYGLGGAFMLSIAFSYWLRRYELVYSNRGVTYGATYTDVTVQLPVYTGLSFLSLAIGLFLLWQTVFWFPKKKPWLNKLSIILPISFLFCVFTFAVLLPNAVQRFIVQPNELARERPYIERGITLTRQAFGLDDIEVRTFEPEGGLTYQKIQANDLTINNIRLWDTRPLLQTNRQLQQIRPYYKFANADIDRYTLKSDNNDTEKRQVILAGRELDYSAVPKEAQTWVNKHLIYTHGYGFTMSPVNTVGAGGLPDYFVKNINSPNPNKGGGLETSSQKIGVSIPIGYPRIYYGEITDNYVMAPTKVNELDYPTGDENVYNSYDGRGGIRINSWWRRLVFAEYLKDWQMLFTGNFTSETKVLLRRNIDVRIRTIAPFLRYDKDPYLVVANANLYVADKSVYSSSRNYLYWLVDAYTTSERYPYSDPGKDEFNYIRNSVKVLIDAYNGKVFFYISDFQDPIINSWKAIFPELFKPLSEMPLTIRSHLRYPVDFYSIQSERLLTYHMTDPQVFYNREDVWQIPTEIYGNEPQRMEPYYLIMKLPTEANEEFILLLPFTPTQRPNLIGWLAGRSDGENYGKLLLYQFPKQELVYGIEQIEALINQDPVISQQIALWNREGSRVLQGNLLAIPIEKSLIYVEPLYLEATHNSLPTLVRVIVAYENKIVMGKTLEEAIKAIFMEPKPTPPIVRGVGER